MPYPVVAIVGYTNAGKSTLFNRLTGADVVAKDQVFATLDPTMREVKLPSGRRIILSDTVGFISDLPTTLVAAFRATLEEVIEADLILHVRDISHPETRSAARATWRPCWPISASTRPRRTRRSWRCGTRPTGSTRPRTPKPSAPSAAAERPPVLDLGADGGGDRGDCSRPSMRASARKDEILSLEIPPREGRLLSWLYDNAEVLEQETAESGAVTARFRIDPTIRGKLEGQLKRAGLVPSAAYAEKAPRAATARRAHTTKR